MKNRQNALLKVVLTEIDVQTLTLTLTQTAIKMYENYDY